MLSKKKTTFLFYFSCFSFPFLIHAIKTSRLKMMLLPPHSMTIAALTAAPGSSNRK